jgi:toxin HigB-1
MIKTFADKFTEELFVHQRSRRFPAEILTRSLDKLRYIAAAEQLQDLRIPPGNRLEALAGDRAGQFSIRVNKGWRICFSWKNGHAFDVELNNHYG